MSKAKKMADIDIDKMIDSDSDDGVPYRPPSAFQNKKGFKNAASFLPTGGTPSLPPEDLNRSESYDEGKDEVHPLPGKKFYGKSKTKKPSHIKTKKIRKSYNNQATISNQSQDNNSNAYDRDFFDRANSNINNQSFQNVGSFNMNFNNNNASNYQPGFIQQPSRFGPKKAKLDVFKSAYNRYNPAAPVPQPQQNQEIDQELQTNLYENLKYGSIITLNLRDEAEEADRKISTKLRISDRVNANKMEKDDYNINCLWKIIPASQHMMQDKILDIIEKDEVPANIEIEFDNFSSEAKANSEVYERSMESPVKFEDTFQLYHESSKRFLCFYPCKVGEIKRLYSNTYSDSDCYYLGCNDYSSDNTHFSFSTVANYQQEEDGRVK